MAVSASTKIAIENFIKGVEEGRHPTIGEVPDPHHSESGVTIAAGFDLGTQNLHDLHQLNLPQDLIGRLTPYLGLRGEEALHFLNAHPLTISENERQLINHALTERLVQRVESRYNHDSAIPFDSIPQAAQVIIASVAHQYGDLQNRTPNFWNDVISQNWHQAISELSNFGDRYQSRHDKEAQYLNENLVPMTQKEINDQLNALAGERSDGHVQVEKQQSLKEPMKEIGAVEPTPPSDERTLDQLLGPPDRPMTPQDIDDLLQAAPGERSDAEVQAEKQQDMDALMEEIGANEPKQLNQPRNDGEGVSAPLRLPDDGFDTTIHDGNAFRRDDDATNSNVGKVEVYPKIENPLNSLKRAPKEGPLPVGPFDFSPEGNLSDPYPGPSDGRTLDQVLGPPEPPMTPQEMNDLLNAAPSQRSDAEVQAEKQQGIEALMKEIGANEPKQSMQSPETGQGRLADGNSNYTPAVENMSNITDRGDMSDAKGYSEGSSNSQGYDSGYSDAGGYDTDNSDADEASGDADA